MNLNYVHSIGASRKYLSVDNFLNIAIWVRVGVMLWVSMLNLRYWTRMSILCFFADSMLTLGRDNYITNPPPHPHPHRHHHRNIGEGFRDANSGTYKQSYTPPPDYKRGESVWMLNLGRRIKVIAPPTVKGWGGEMNSPQYFPSPRPVLNVLGLR